MFLTTLFILIDGFYLYNSIIPTTIDNRIKLYSESLISISDWVVMDKEFIMDLVRPIHPFTSFLNPIYMFSTVSIIVFVVISSILMGTEFKNRTIKIKKSNFSILHIFLSKILTVIYIYISYIIFTVIINIIVSLVFWSRIKNEYGFFLNKFSLNFDFSLYKSFKEITIFIIVSSVVIIFYSMLSICLTYCSSLSTFGMSICILPFVRFESEISKIIVLPMDIYYHILRKSMTTHNQGFYMIPEGNLLNSMTNVQIVIACVVMFALEVVLLFFITLKKKRI